jgi:hypothetical protein
MVAAVVVASIEAWYDGGGGDKRGIYAGGASSKYEETMFSEALFPIAFSVFLFCCLVVWAEFLCPTMSSSRFTCTVLKPP